MDSEKWEHRPSSCAGLPALAVESSFKGIACLQQSSLYIGPHGNEHMWESWVCCPANPAVARGQENGEKQGLQVSELGWDPSSAFPASDCFCLLVSEFNGEMRMSFVSFLTKLCFPICQHQVQTFWINYLFNPQLRRLWGSYRLIPLLHRREQVLIPLGRVNSKPGCLRPEPLPHYSI